MPSPSATATRVAPAHVTGAPPQPAPADTVAFPSGNAAKAGPAVIRIASSWPAAAVYVAVVPSLATVPAPALAGRASSATTITSGRRRGGCSDTAGSVASTRRRAEGCGDQHLRGRFAPSGRHSTFPTGCLPFFSFHFTTLPTKPGAVIRTCTV